MKWSKEFLKAAGIRAVRTGAQTLLSMLGVGMALTDVNWISALSVTVVAMLMSILTSLVTDLPETTFDGIISSSQLEGIGEFKSGDIVSFKISDEEVE